MGAPIACCNIPTQVAEREGGKEQFLPPVVKKHETRPPFASKQCFNGPLLAIFGDQDVHALCSRVSLGASKGGIVWRQGPTAGLVLL